MDSHSDLAQQLDKIEQENGFYFALKWGGVGTAIALCLLVAGCDSFFPKETPRYNTVVGERRVPVLNAPMLNPSNQPQPSQQQAAPVPMVTADAAPQRPSTQPEPSVIQAAPAPRPAQPAASVAPYTSAPSQPAASEPSMVDQMTGWFTSEPEQPHPAGDFPQLQATEIPSAAPMPRPAPPQDLQAEMAALEQELFQAQQQQSALAAPAAQPMLGNAPTRTMPTQQSYETPAAPSPASDSMPWQSASPVEPTPMASALKTAAPAPMLLPPPPPAPSYERTAPMQQPQAAPEYPEYYAQPAPQSATAAFAPTPTPQQAYSAPAPINVPAAPPVYGQLGVPSSLIPPDMEASFGEGYLPASRYQGRRLRY